MRTSWRSAVPAKRVIPCLDVTAGRVVKGVRFVDLKDAGDPAELAAHYDRAGADEIVFLDITASSDERRILLDAVARTADQVFIPLTVGGGVRTVEDMQELLSHGADRGRGRGGPGGLDLPLRRAHHRPGEGGAGRRRPGGAPVTPDFSKGLVPVVAQDAETGEVLTLAYMDEEAWSRTRETGRAWF